MKTKTKNIIAISVALVAVLSIAFVLTLALLKVEPMSELKASSSCQIYFGSNQLTGVLDLDEKITSKNENANRKYESTSVNEILDMCGFSVFKSWSQGKYDYSPRLADGSSYISNNDIMSYYSGTAAANGAQFTLRFSFDEIKEISIEGSDGTIYKQKYDTAVVILTDTAGWVGNITMYVFEYANVYGSFDKATVSTDTLGYYRFYPVQVGAVTSEAIDVLSDIFDKEPGAVVSAQD